MTLAVAALRELVELSRQELANADWMLDHHQPFLYGLCRCNRVWPCNVAHQYGKAARYHRVRLSLLEPRLALAEQTQVLPEVRR